MPVPPPLNWEDVRMFGALARTSSLREAAAQLGLTHPTVKRRLDRLEASLGLRLFHRRPDGLHLTVQGEEIRESVKEAERSMQRISRLAVGADTELRGPIRVTMSTEMARLLTPALAVFAQQWPLTPLAISTGNPFADLGDGSVDVAIRILGSGKKPEGHLTGRKAISGGAHAVYGQVSSGCWIGTGPAAGQTGWTATDDFDHLPIGPVIPDGVVRREACLHGMGIAMLPCLLEAPGLPRLTEPVPIYDIWVLVHPDLRRNPRLRLFRNAMVEALKAMEGKMRGRDA